MNNEWFLDKPANYTGGEIKNCTERKGYDWNLDRSPLWQKIVGRSFSIVFLVLIILSSTGVLWRWLGIDIS